MTRKRLRLAAIAVTDAMLGGLFASLLVGAVLAGATPTAAESDRGERDGADRHGYWMSRLHRNTIAR